MLSTLRPFVLVPTNSIMFAPAKLAVAVGARVEHAVCAVMLGEVIDGV